MKHNVYCTPYLDLLLSFMFCLLIHHYRVVRKDEYIYILWMYDMYHYTIRN
jgi:hypothetical protein